jgi:hypothetical protein
MLHIDLSIPPGSTASLELPKNIDEYTIDGKLYQSKKTDLNIIKSGKYKIIYRLN